MNTKLTYDIYKVNCDHHLFLGLFFNHYCTVTTLMSKYINDNRD